MSENFDRIRRMYRDSFETHGDSPASLLTPKGRNELRFRALDLFARNGKTILDYGCGLGYLFKYLEGMGRDVKYTGVDILPEFVQSCIERYAGRASFDLIDPLRAIDGRYDIVFASGVFNIPSDTNQEVAKNYAFEKLVELFQVTDEILVCDFLSAFVDYRQSNSLHFSIAELAEFCSSRLSRRFQIRHDLLPYEVTMLVWKDDEIKRPENMYACDWTGATR